MKINDVRYFNPYELNALNSNDVRYFNPYELNAFTFLESKFV